MISSPWIESHLSLKEHPKMFALALKMGWDPDLAIGKLHRFWWWCLEYALDGNLQPFNDAQLGLAMGVAIADCKRLVTAMVESSWIDRAPYFRVHDWWEYVGRYLQTKWKNTPAKWQAVRDAYGGGADAPPVRDVIEPPNNSPEMADGHPPSPYPSPVFKGPLPVPFKVQSFKALKGEIRARSPQEGELLAICREALGQSFESWAGCWVACIRGAKGHPPKPGKVRRVMAAVIEDQKAGKVIDDVGAYAWDLFTKRFAD